MNDEIHPMFQDIWRVFYFRCRDCDISIKLRSQEDLKSKDIVCPKCQNNNIRHVKTTTSAFGSIDGNVGYVSFEKQSDLNIKSEGREKVVNIIKADNSSRLQSSSAHIVISSSLPSSSFTYIIYSNSINLPHILVIALLNFYIK